MNESNTLDPTHAFELLDLRAGRITRVEINDKARKPAYKLWIDFGALGEKTSSAQITDHYSPQDLQDRLVIAAVNLGTRRIAGFKSQVLVLGVPDDDDRVILIEPASSVTPGVRVY